MTLGTSAAFSEIVIRSVGVADGASEIGVLAGMDGAGNATGTTTEWTVTGSASESGAFGGSVQVTFDAMKNVSTNVATLGNKLTDGTVDRDPNGYIGVQGAPNSTGIGADAINREGIQIRFDAFTGIPAGLGVRITKINVQNVGRPGTDPVGTESFTIVNLMTRQSKVFVPAAGEEGDFDVTALDLVRAGNNPGPVAAVFSGDTGGFRIDGLSFVVQQGTNDPPPIVSWFTVNDPAIATGKSVRLSWSVLGADSISISPAPGDVSGQPQGFAMVSPTSTTTYTLTATNAAGSATANVPVYVDASATTAEGPVGNRGIRYVSGQIAILDPAPASVRTGDAERYSAIQLIPEKAGLSLASGVEVDHLVNGPVTLLGTNGNPGTLPQGVPLNSYLLHGDVPDAAPPQTILTTTITFDAPIVGLVYRTRTGPISGSYSNRLEQTDAIFGLDGMLFEEEVLSTNSYQRRSVDSEVADEISIGPDGLTLTATFRLNGSDPKNLDELRVITRAAASPAPAGAPNILFFLADDMGIGDTSAYQDWSGLSNADQIKTPNLERLADLGLRFTDAHVQNRCTPTRYSLITGRYAWRAGLLKGVLDVNENPPLVERERPTLPAFLKGMGYLTGMVGKWHLGLEYRQTSGLPASGVSADGYGWNQADLRVLMRDTPLDHGFDFFHGFSRSHLTSGPDGQTDNGPTQSIGPGWMDGRRVTGATGNGKELDGTYDWHKIGQALLDHATGFMSSVVTNSTERQRPFFLYFASHANHTVYTPDTAINGTPVAGQSQWKNGSLTGDVRRDFVYLNDVLLGKLMNYLETTDDPRSPGAKLINNTMVIFASDNGADINDYRAVGNLREHKTWLYEGGTRVPLLVYWKNGGIGDATEGNGGKTQDALIALQDFYPTLAELLGHPLAPPTSGTDAAVDGFSRLAVLRGEESDPRPPAFSNEQNGNTQMSIQYHGTIPLNPPQSGYWKLIFNSSLLANAGTGTAVPVELYNLETDRLEATNLLSNPAYTNLVTEFSAWAERIVNGNRAREVVPAPGMSFAQDNAAWGITLQAAPFLFYDIWASDELQTWERVTTLQSATPGTLIKTFPYDRPQRFFRVLGRQ